MSFPVTERAGLIWGTLDPTSSNDIDALLQGFDEFIETFGLDSWQIAGKHILTGTNWKLAFEAHLEFYHLPVLHKNSFGPASSNKALYYFWGPHQRLIPPADKKKGVVNEHNLFRMADTPEEDWPIESMILGEWIIFPNVSINLFYEGGLGVLISQVIPGANFDESRTVQTFLHADELSSEAITQVRELSDFLKNVVNDEDLATSEKQQHVLMTGLMKEVTFGRNEAGIQHFHQWLNETISTDKSNGVDAALFSFEPKWSAP